MHKLRNINLNFGLHLKAIQSMHYRWKTKQFQFTQFALVNFEIRNLSRAFYNMCNAINELLIKKYSRQLLPLIVCVSHKRQKLQGTRMHYSSYYYYISNISDHKDSTRVELTRFEQGWVGLPRRKFVKTEVHMREKLHSSKNSHKTQKEQRTRKNNTWFV